MALVDIHYIDHPNHNDQMRDLISYALDESGTYDGFIDKENLKKGRHGLGDTMVYTVNVCSKAIEFIEILNAHKNIKHISDFKDVKGEHFFILVSNCPETEKALFELNETIRCMDEDLSDQLTEQMIQNQKELASHITAINEYLKSSGIIHYKEFMETLVETLSEMGIVDEESLKTAMFENLH